MRRLLAGLVCAVVGHRMLRESFYAQRRVSHVVGCDRCKTPFAIFEYRGQYPLPRAR